MPPYTKTVITTNLQLSIQYDDMELTMVFFIPHYSQPISNSRSRGKLH